MTPDFKSFSKMSSTPEDRFIGKCLMMVTYTHVAHFMVKSYSQHMALGDFYEQLQDHVDEFAEVYVGTGMPYRPVLSLNPSFDAITEIKALAAEADTIRSELDSSLQTILDDIKSLCFRTIYKLENLA